jgi:hypothetical protein
MRPGIASHAPARESALSIIHSEYVHPRSAPTEGDLFKSVSESHPDSKIPSSSAFCRPLCCINIIALNDTMVFFYFTGRTSAPRRIGEPVTLTVDGKVLCRPELHRATVTLAPSSTWICHVDLIRSGLFAVRSPVTARSTAARSCPPDSSL